MLLLLQSGDAAAALTLLGALRRAGDDVQAGAAGDGPAVPAPVAAAAYSVEAEAYAAMGNSAEAAKCLLAAVTAAPSDPRIVDRAASALVSVGRIADAVQLLSAPAVLSAQIDDADAGIFLYRASRLCFESGWFDEYVKLFLRACGAAAPVEALPVRARRQGAILSVCGANAFLSTVEDVCRRLGT